eukprot:scaffold22113_cov64-Phaeocystis_antarctica.AAC.4
MYMHMHMHMHMYMLCVVFIATWRSAHAHAPFPQQQGGAGVTHIYSAGASREGDLRRALDALAHSFTPRRGHRLRGPEEGGRRARGSSSKRGYATMGNRRDGDRSLASLESNGWLNPRRKLPRAAGGGRKTRTTHEFLERHTFSTHSRFFVAK